MRTILISSAKVLFGFVLITPLLVVIFFALKFWWTLFELVWSLW